jgi:hypothetical protein
MTLPGEALQLHEERLQRMSAESAPFRFHRPIVRLARAVAVSTDGAIGRVRRAGVDAEDRLPAGQANTAADEVVRLVAD